MEQNLILQIQALYNQFTKAEKKVADYVTTHLKEVIFMSITDLADACEVGDTSVYRFCRTLNLQGYQEFKMKLSLCQGNVSERVTNDKTSFQSMAETVMELNISAIRETYMLLNMQELDRVLEMFDKAKRVFFYGVGDSLLSAQAACNKFLRITSKVLSVTDAHMQAMSAATATEDDLFIFLSYSGSSKDTVEVARLAKESGARVVCISHFQKSPLTAYSDAVLLCGANEEPLDGGSMAGKMGQLYLIDLLYQEYYSRNYEICKISNEKACAAVLSKLH